MALLHATVSPGAELQLPWDPTFNALLYVLDGMGQAGSGGRPIRRGQLTAYGSGDFLVVRADARQEPDRPTLEILILGGEPIRERVVQFGPFVMNTKAQIGQALEDFEAGRLGTVPADALMPHVPDPNPIRAEHTGI
jgi:redox-sensitive bicupin YhaK (pirin superfamily)